MFWPGGRQSVHREDFCMRRGRSKRFGRLLIRIGRSREGGGRGRLSVALKKWSFFWVGNVKIEPRSCMCGVGSSNFNLTKKKLLIIM